MNIIGNSCASSYIVRDILHEQFNNPFVWCSMTPRDMIQIINNYDKINWKKYKVEFYKNNSFNCQCVNITVDDLFTIKYPHYVFRNCETKIQSVNVFSNDIIKFATEKYETRLDRMLENNEPPIFIVGGSWNDQIPPIDFMNYITNSKLKSNVIIGSNPSIKQDNYKFAKWIYEEKLKSLDFKQFS